jgi:hypothetical protein
MQQFKANLAEYAKQAGPDNSKRPAKPSRGGLGLSNWSGIPDSNRRPSAWESRSLPTA